MDDLIATLLEKLLSILEKNSQLVWIAAICGFVFGCLFTMFYYSYFKNYKIQRDLDTATEKLEVAKNTISELNNQLDSQNQELERLRTEQNRIRIKNATNESIPTY